MPEYNKYQNYTASDFLTDEYFQKWILNPDPETDHFWSQFLLENASKSEEVSRAKKILESIEFKEDYPPKEKVREYLARIMESIDETESSKPRRNSGFFKLNRWVAAASAVLILGTGYFFFNNQPDAPIATVSDSESTLLVNDVPPGGNRATLTLGNGETIILDSTGNGTISTQGSSIVTKLANGQIAYEGADLSAGSEMVYNTISTPRGGQYNLTLSDGSRVWLNAASSLRFPASFRDSERKVELTGEAYFEIAHKAESPFRVLSGNSETEVLGTHFNVSGYADELNLKATLFEGSIKVGKGVRSVVLRPGQQASIHPVSGNVTINSSPNLEEVIAWKNGLFYFDNTDIREVMRQVGRWYDLEVEFKGDVADKKITGKIYRNVNISKVLRIMEALKIKFKIEGQTIIVTE